LALPEFLAHNEGLRRNRYGFQPTRQRIAGKIPMNTDEQTTASLTGLRVIIVEDEVLLAMCIRETIEDEGGIVAGTAQTVDQAATLVSIAEFDVAILDLCLHGKPVGTIAAAIVGRGCAVIFSTGSNASDVPVEFQGWPVLCKPYMEKDIVAALRAACFGRTRVLSGECELISGSLTHAG